MASTKFEAHDRELAKVLFGDRKYRIPRFQRPYAWGPDQISEYWDDLRSTDESYFIGSIIVNDEHEKSTGYADVIDGQQRLLTTTIFVAAMRDIMGQLDSKKAELFQRKDIAIEDRGGSQAYRIVPDESIEPFFLKYIQSYDPPKKPNPDISKFVPAILLSKPKTVVERRVKDNYEFFFSGLRSLLIEESDRETQIELLEDLRQRVSDLVVIDVEIHKEEDAYEIFETTNARGLELSVADLLKNLIFRRITTDARGDKAKDAWQQITSNVEKTGTELRKFIRYFWISRNKFVSEKQLYREIKREVSDWPGLLEDLRKDSEWYNKLLEGDQEDFAEFKHGPAIFKAVLALRLMKVSQCHVFLLAIIRNYERLGTDPVGVFQFIERFSFQYSAICKLPTNRVEKTYSKYAIKLQKAFTAKPKAIPGEVQKVFQQLKKELTELLPSEQLFTESFREVSYSRSEAARLLTKYILAEVNNHLQTTDELIIDFNKVNLEHILPQNPHADWKLSKAAIKPYVNRLGNLTLISGVINSSIQNGVIEKKLPELKKSKLPVTIAVVARLKRLKNVWNEAQILRRQEELGKLAYEEIWFLDA